MEIVNVFYKLLIRLNDFENDKYRINNADLLEKPFDLNINYDGICANISKGVNKFTDAEVCSEAKKYEQRVVTMLKRLKPIQGVNSKDIQKSFRDSWKAELKAYLHCLRTIQKVRQPTQTKENKNYEDQKIGEVLTYKLPDKLTVKELKKKFTPKLSIKEAGLFLYYLREMEVIPYYSNQTLGQIATLLFCRNGKNVEDEVFSQIDSVLKNKKDSTALLSNVIDPIRDKLNDSIKLKSKY